MVCLRGARTDIHWLLPSTCPLPVQDKSWYRAKHHSSGQEGLLAAAALRQREALSTDPKLSLMP